LDESVAPIDLYDRSATLRLESPTLDVLDAFLDRNVRLAIEQAYYARITALGELAEILKDEIFIANPVGHAALFADHGPVHARDVACQTIEVIEAVHGTLIPARSPDRLAWMKAYGAFTAIAHDIGMVDSSPVGRIMHPEYATQEILSSAFDEIFAALWATDKGGIASRLTSLSLEGAIGSRPPAVVLREMIAMTNCHSKRKVPVGLLNERSALRRTMQAAATVSLDELNRQQQGGLEHLLESDRFEWLEVADEAGREVVADVVDSLRALRCADALRQRGTMLKTSGQYEIFVDKRTANAVYALRDANESLYLLEVLDPVSAGESNLSSSQLDADGDLRISFYHGRFGSHEAEERAAYSVAKVLNSIQGDAIESFLRSDLDVYPDLKPAADLAILIESPDDNPAFAGLVRRALELMNPMAAGRVRFVTSLAAAAPMERDRYLKALNVDWDIDRRVEVLRKVALCGHRTERIDPDSAFREVRLIHLRRGDRLIDAGAPSGFVYLPLDEGLRGRPLGGYEEFEIKPWILVGVTGVIRGAVRNADVFAERDLTLIAIPKGVFLDHWHSTYDHAAFAALFKFVEPPAVPR